MERAISSSVLDRPMQKPRAEARAFTYISQAVFVVALIIDLLSLVPTDCKQSVSHEAKHLYFQMNGRETLLLTNSPTPH